VDDIVQGLLLARNMDGCQALNIGTEETETVDEAVGMVLELTNSSGMYAPKIRHDLTKPTGPHTRVCSNARYRALGGTLTPFLTGLERTMEWYAATHDREFVAANLERLLIERK
jgi:nucleoside-diphosphate-sugar epimerase